MLDAFQRSARAERDAEAQAAQAPRGGAFAKARKRDEAPRSETESRPKPPVRRPVPVFDPRPEEVLGTGPRPPLSGIPVWIPTAVVVLVIAIAGAYWIGGRLGGETHAEEPGTGPPLEAFETDLGLALEAPSGAGGSSPQAPAPSSARASEASDLTEDDRRFLDPNRSRYTVRAIYFDNDREGWSRSLSTYYYLRRAGLPAIAPIEKGEIVVICVGAEPSRTGELEQIRDRLQALPGPPPESEARAFESAFFVNIDDQIDREP